jgi:hypothetical protein
MAKKPEPPKPIVWNMYKIAAKAERLGIVEATDRGHRDREGRRGIQCAAHKLMAIRRLVMITDAGVVAARPLAAWLRGPVRGGICHVLECPA